MNIAKIFTAIFFISIISFSAHAQNINDRELKKNVVPITNSLRYINKLEPVTYEFNQDKYKQLSLPSGPQFGFITADVQHVLPAVITPTNLWYNSGKSNDRSLNTNTVDLQKLVPILVGAIKEQQEQIEELKTALQELTTLRDN